MVGWFTVPILLNYRVLLMSIILNHKYKLTHKNKFNHKSLPVAILLDAISLKLDLGKLMISIIE